MKTTFTIKEIQQFVSDHLQSKIDHNELELAGIRTAADWRLYETALLEGIINGIVMAGGAVESIETEDK